MNKPLRLSMVVLLALLLLATSGAVLASNTLALPRWVVGGGGGLAAGSSVSLNGTLGQPAVGSFTAGSVTLKAGYWTGASRSTIYLPIVIR